MKETWQLQIIQSTIAVLVLCSVTYFSLRSIESIRNPCRPPEEDRLTQKEEQKHLKEDRPLRRRQSRVIKEHNLGISMAHLATVTTRNLDIAYAGKTDLMHKGHIKGGKLVIIMVGLPGRGKSYMARKIARYLNWINYPTRVFNIGNYRRKFLGTDHTANFFDPENQEGYKLRMQMAKAAMTDMMTYLQDDKGDVGIYDGTNSTAKRRKWIQSQIETQSNFHLLFIESVCNDEAIIEHNVLATKTKSPDYKHSTPEKAVADFNLRIEMYRKVYEPLGESDSNLSYVQTINAGERLVMNKVYGFLPMKILSFVSNLHIVPRPVMLTRHGENLDNIDNRIGGDAALSLGGISFSKSLSELLSQKEDPQNPLCVWSSTAKSARETAAMIGVSHRYVQWRALREIEAGTFDSLSYSEIKTHYGTEYRLREQDKLNYRYPQGESYLDVISRLEPVIYELERQRSPVVIIAHQAVLRCLYAYFLDLPAEKIPYLSVPLHCMIELQPDAYGCKETRYNLAPDPVVHPP